MSGKGQFEPCRLGGEDSQLRGNLHTHTTNSDGPLPPQETVDAYADLGYDFLMISDHDLITDIGTLDNRGLVLIPGNEITRDGVHLLHVDAHEVTAPVPNRQTVIDAINAQGGFVIMNHPNWGSDFIHCRQSDLESLHGYAGIEIFNGVSERVEGSALALDRWDMLLSKGRHVWGFGNDDPHEPEDFGVVWNMVFAEHRNAESVLDAMRRGCFYVSTGVRLDVIHTEGTRLVIQSEDAECFRVFGEHGMLLATVEAHELAYDLSYSFSTSYIRVECHGFGARMAWTQPFFVRP